METENNEMFSEEYSTESTSTESQNLDNVEEIESTELLDNENYTIIKPRRIIIKAKIVND